MSYFDDPFEGINQQISTVGPFRKTRVLVVTLGILLRAGWRAHAVYFIARIALTSLFIYGIYHGGPAWAYWWMGLCSYFLVMEAIEYLMKLWKL